MLSYPKDYGGYSHKYIAALTQFMCKMTPRLPTIEGEGGGESSNLSNAII